MDVINDVINRFFDLRPEAIISTFDLRKPIYAPLSSYGHMGREDLGVAWEDVTLAKDIKSYVEAL